MEINIFDNPLDTRHEIKLLVFTAETQEAKIIEPEINNIINLFEEFIQAGSVSNLADKNEITQWLPSKKELRESHLLYTWPCFPFGGISLAILFRMLAFSESSNHIAHVFLSGKTKYSDNSSNIEPSELEELILSELPPVIEHLPFSLELSYFGSWINIECDFSFSISPELAQELNKRVHSWAEVATAGGFQIIEDIEDTEEENEFKCDEEKMEEDEQENIINISLSEPTVGDDFVAWQGSVIGVPAESLGCLINIFSNFSHRKLSITSVYIG